MRGVPSINRVCDLMPSTKAMKQLHSFDAAEHTYVKVRCEGDRGRPIFATAAKAGEADAAVFEDAVYVFIVLHSDAVVLIKVRDKKENQFYGQVASPPLGTSAPHLRSAYTSHASPSHKTHTVLRSQ